MGAKHGGNKMAILKTEKAIIRAMSGLKLIEKKSSQELRILLGFMETFDGLARASEMQW